MTALDDILLGLLLAGLALSLPLWWWLFIKPFVELYRDLREPRSAPDEPETSDPESG